MDSTVRIAVLLMPALGLCALSCSRNEPPLARQDPAYKIPAMKAAAAKKDSSALPQLVDALDSDDPAVRLYAIMALERLTGQTFDYQFYADRPERQPAIQRWKHWLTGQPPTTQPATQSTATQG